VLSATKARQTEGKADVTQKIWSWWMKSKAEEPAVWFWNEAVFEQVALGSV